MDVLGLLSNISQVVDLLVKIGVMCSIYCFDVKNAPKEVRLLLREVDRLTVVIKELEILINGSKGAAKIESPALRQTVFDLRKLLAELVAKLDLGAKNTSTRALWPFKKREIHDIIASIDRQKANIVLNMSIEQTSILIDVHQEFVLSKLRVAEAATFDSSIDGEQSYCLPGTRTEVIAQIQQWSAERDGQSIFWLNGMAGTGKSTISRTVAQLFTNNDVLGASFFFKRGEGNRGRATFLFTTIATQLVRRLPCLAPHIREVLVIDPFIHEKPLNDQFEKLILDPLRKNPRCWGPNLLIVIDALDECGSEDDMRTMISVFSKAQQTISPRVKFFLTSRPELPIRLGFEQINGKYDDLLLAAVPATTIALDIELFMKDKLRTIKTEYNMSVSEHRKIAFDWPGNAVLQKLIATAIPLFIAAATICRFLSDRRLGSPHHQLAKLLEYQTIKISGMDMTYLPVLDRLVTGLSPSKRQEVLHRFRYLIGSIITLARPLSIRSLSHLLGVSTDIIEDQLDLLHSVLSVPTDLDTPVRLLHLSFRDFLVDAEETPSKNSFWVDEEESHSKLFSQCLKLLSRSLKEDICCLQSPGALQSGISQTVIDEHLPTEVRYACMYWAYHLRLSNRKIRDNDETHKFLANYLLKWLEALSILKQSAESIYMIDALLDGLEETNARDVGDLLRDARRFIFTNLDIMNKAPLQIYSSALIFAPVKSIVRELFAKSVPLWLTIRPKMQSHWDPYLATFEIQCSYGTHILSFPTSNKFLFLYGRKMEIWDIQTVSCIGVYDDVLSESFSFSSDGGELFYLTWHEILQVVSTTTRNCVAEFRGHADKIIHAMFSPDGQQLASSSKDGSLKIWDRTTRKYHRGKTKVWDTNSEIQPERVESHGSAVLEVVFSPDKKRILTTAGERTIKLWDTVTGKCITTGEEHVLFAKVPLVVPHDILSTPYDHVMNHNDLYGWPRSIEFSPDSSKFVSSAGYWSSGSVKLWNANTGEYELLYEAAQDSATSIAISPDGTAVSSAFRDGMVIYWDIATQKILGSFGGETRDLSYSTFSPDGTYLMLGYVDGSVRLYHLPSGKFRKMSEAHERPVELMTMSVDGTRLASRAPGEIKIWETNTCTCITSIVNLASTLSGTADISQILFSPDSRYLIVLHVARRDDDATRNEKVRILDASTGQCVAELGICGFANHMEFNSAGSCMLTNVGTLIFDPPTFQKAKTIGLGLSNDGEWITWDSRNLLWLPTAFRISASDINVAASLIALGSRLGRLLLIGIDSSKIPRLLSR
ncbi:hypothetical protein ACSS6W_007313 [Trichoderma asperelloides]